MATQLKELKKAGYAVIGVGDFVVDKTRGLFDKARKTGREDIVSVYQDLSKRGQRWVTKVQRSKPVKRATAQTKQASRQLKGAGTSLKKATSGEKAAS